MALAPLLFEVRPGTGYPVRVSVKPPAVPRASAASPAAEETPKSASGVVAREVAASPPTSHVARRDSDPPSVRPLTPYRARLDVEMDDTAVSKVRDPSVSIRLGPDGALPGESPRRRPPSVREALASGVVGVVIGVIVVIALAFLIRALLQ